MIFQERCLKMVNNPLVFYFEKLKDDYDLKTYGDIAKYLDISIGTVKNAYGGRTINPSKRLVEHIAVHFNKNPNVILKDIYNGSFVEPCNEYTKLVTLSLYYNFEYALFYDNQNFIMSHKIDFPLHLANMHVNAIVRLSGHEVKPTAIVEWSRLNSLLAERCNCTYNPILKNDYILMALSNLYYMICSDEFDDLKRLIVVFAYDEEEDYQLFRKMCNDSKHRVLPLLYDENAEYSIRDVDMLNGIG